MIDQVGGGFHHAAGAATGAKATALAAERDQVFIAAAIAPDAQEAVFQQTALQVVLELPADKLGQVATRPFDFLNEAREMFGDKGIKPGLFWPMAAVGRSSTNRDLSGHRLCIA